MQTANVPRELLGVQTSVLQDLGGIELSGYDFEAGDPYVPGAVVPLTLLWRTLEDGSTRDYDIILADEFGKAVQTTSFTVGGTDIRGGQYVRQTPTIKLPTAIAAGNYFLQLTVHGGSALPFQPNSITLGKLRIKAQ